MGLQARMLGAFIAVAATLFSVSTADAQPSLVRVESPALQFAPGALVDRTPVAPLDAVVVTDPVTPANTATCAATSPIAALNAAVGPAGWTASVAPGGVVTITSIKGLTQPAVPPMAPAGTKPTWTWASMVSALPAPDPCHYVMDTGSEALFFPSCTDKTKPSTSCFTGGALYMRIRDGGPTDLAPQTVPGRGAPVVAHVIVGDLNGGIAPTLQATVTTDEGLSSSSNDPHKEGLATFSFTEFGPHWVRANQNGMVPVRMPVCVSEGADGFCGTTRIDPPPEIPYAPSPCDTNGHDGFCGTVDTSGPVTHVSNITDKQVFKKAKAPGQVKGTIAEDPAAVQYVKLRITRVFTQRVRIKAKKAKHKSKKKPKVRYRRVKRCQAWDDNTALLETAKCGTKNAKWFESDLDDLKQNFKYSFALKLPPGTYTLEVQSADLDNHLDAPEPGRNVITFTVAST